MNLSFFGRNVCALFIFSWSCLQIQGAEKNLINYEEMYEALGNQDCERLEKLLKTGANPNHEAYLCCTSDLEKIQMLISYKADVNKSNGYEMPLHHAIGYARDKDVIEMINLLLDAKADVNACKVDGRNPLMHACSHFSLWGPRNPILMRLLQHPGIEMSYVNNEKGNAFHLLATHRQLNNTHMPALIKMLVLGADPNSRGEYITGKEITDKEKHTALQHYSWWGSPDCQCPFKTNKHVIKSAILILEIQRNRIRDTKAELLKSTALVNGLLDIVTGYACGIAPSSQDLDEATAAYKDIRPVLDARILASIFSTFDA